MYAIAIIPGRGRFVIDKEVESNTFGGPICCRDCALPTRNLPGRFVAGSRRKLTKKVSFNDMKHFNF